MASLFEYFKKDQGKTYTLGKDFEVKDKPGGITLLKIQTRLHIDFEANALYVSIYIPRSDEGDHPARSILSVVDEILRGQRTVSMEGGFQGQEPATSAECVFTGRIYIYSEARIPANDKDHIRARAAELRYNVKFREPDYAEERNRWERPLAFISHDSRDKEEIATL